jgi:D-arabinose 1-dehydrogenase-like Zn-dependent alcohol dehydrogenase
MIPSTQQGYRIKAWGSEPVWEEFPVPTPGPGELLIQVETCSIGLTVLNCINGDLSDDPALLPRVPGHEYVGIVRAVGPGADPALIGKRIVPYFYLSCGRCEHCVAGNDSRCVRLAGWVAIHRDGGYAPWTTLPEHNAIVMPDGLDAVAASAVPDAVSTPFHVCNTRANIGPRDRVVVFGAAGGIGIHMVQMARLLGAQVAGIELSDDKLAVVAEHGGMPVRGDDLTSLAPGLWDGARPTVVIDLVGADSTLQWSQAALGMGGRMIVLTTFRDRTSSFDPRELVFREISLIGSRFANRSEVAAAAQLVATGRITPVISRSVGPEDVLDVHADLKSGTLVGRGVLVWPSA